MPTIPFRFDADRHEYWALDTGELLPHITGILAAAGKIDTRWYTQASRDRGTLVHAWTMDIDFNVLPELDAVDVSLRPFLEAYKTFAAIERPVNLAIEVALVHPHFRYGGRIDRQVRMRGKTGVLEIKTGGTERWHMLQTALQAMLQSEEIGIPAETLGRWVVYLRKVGKIGTQGRFSLEEHRDPADFAEVRQILDRVLPPGCEVDHEDLPF